MNVITLCFLLFFPPVDSASIREADSLFIKSKTFWYNNRDSAIYYLNAALVKSRATAYLKGEANALKGLGLLSYSSTQQIQYYTQALNIRQKLRDSAGVGVSLADIGTIYQRLNDSARMMDYYRRSYAIRKKIGDNGGIALCLILFGQQNQAMNNESVALEKFREALHYRLLHGEANGIGFAYINIAQAHMNLGHYDSAIHYVKKAKEKFIASGNRFSVQWLTSVYAGSLFALHRNEEALSLLTQLEHSENLSTTNLELASALNERLLHYKEALGYQHKLIQLWREEKKTNDETTARNLIADFEFKIREDQKRQEEARALSEKQRRNNLQFLVIAVVLTAAVTIIIALRKRASPQVINISTFMIFLFVFEFVIVLFDPVLQKVSGDTPMFILLGNVVVAAIIAPLHNLADRYFKGLLNSNH